MDFSLSAIISVFFVCSHYPNLFSGEEYIEDLKSDVGKVIGYKCTLCDCRFNDMVARTAHVKGRRHRLNYKVCYLCLKTFDNVNKK